MTDGLVPGPGSGQPDAGGIDDVGGPGGDAGRGDDASFGFDELDSDEDGIADIHEGRGRWDTDRDGVPDHLDLDSDGDGISDRDEAGDADLFTPPIDSDGNDIPDVRDLDADGDAIPDALESAADFDGDGIANYRDLDADADGISDRLEGSSDPDEDTLGNWLDLDSDGDGLADIIEGTADPDRDGIAAFLDLDSDEDAIADEDEGTDDFDGDGVPAFLDTDSDGDLISDLEEGIDDPDGDGKPSYLDLDADGDGIGDAFEGPADMDGDGTPNYLDLDSDQDGLPDHVERRVLHPETAPRDTDGDGWADFLDQDADNDFIPDAFEGAVDTDGDGQTDDVDLDSDADGLLDREEAGDQDPTTPPWDADGDGTADYLDLDSDDDSIPDGVEGRRDSDRDGVLDRRDVDSDDDGVPDRQESGDIDPATPPVDTDGDTLPDYRDIDADDDGLPDASELGCPGSSERTRIDSDDDAFQDLAEVAMGSDPCDPASGIDGFYFVLPGDGPSQSDSLVFDDTEIDAADISLNVDTTGSMGEEITNLRRSLGTIIVPGIQAVVPSPAFAVSSFQDFPIAPFGNADAGDLPFVLNQRVTSDSALAQLALNELSTLDGEDTRESGLESLFQIATGQGVQWSTSTTDTVDPFDPSFNRIPGVAEGEGGGVGFRQDALPVVVHVSDAPSHLGRDYPASIEAADADVAANALVSAGLRVITITGEDQPRPWSEDQLRARFGAYCRGEDEPVLGTISGPQGTDVDWFELEASSSGAQVRARVEAFEVGSSLNPMVAVYDGEGRRLGFNDDADGIDSTLNVTLSGPSPHFVAVSAFNDPDFDGSGAVTAGHYFLDVTVNGVRYAPRRAACIDAGRTLNTAYPLSPNPVPATHPEQCEDACFARVELEDLRVPYGIARRSGAQVPPCAWDLFGNGRPAGCGFDQCCTGLSGTGVPPDPTGACPLSFEVAADGSGIDQALVAGTEALVNFSEFTITTRVRADPTTPEVDTSCFIQRVTAQQGVAPNPCAPAPLAVDQQAETPGPEGFSRVVPGATLEFEVVASPLDLNGRPCVAPDQSFRVYRAFIDVIADDVAQLATRDVVIVVPPGQNAGGN